MLLGTRKGECLWFNHSIGCNFDFAQEDELSEADIVIDDLIELKTILSQLKD